MKLFGEEIAVNARIVNFKGLSSHADRDHLLAWVDHFAPTLSRSLWSTGTVR